MFFNSDKLRQYLGFVSIDRRVGGVVSKRVFFGNREILNPVKFDFLVNTSSGDKFVQISVLKDSDWNDLTLKVNTNISSESWASKEERRQIIMDARAKIKGKLFCNRKEAA